MSDRTSKQWLLELMGDHDFTIPGDAFNELVEALDHNESARLRGEAMETLRRACAEILGADPETWPEHGNASLAIASALQLAINKSQPDRDLDTGRRRKAVETLLAEGWKWQDGQWVQPEQQGQAVAINGARVHRFAKENDVDLADILREAAALARRVERAAHGKVTGYLPGAMAAEVAMSEDASGLRGKFVRLMPEVD